MELRNRQAKILQDIFCKREIPMDVILEQYGISKRTLYYDLNKINEWLREYDFGFVSILDKKIIIDVKNRAEIERQMHKGNEYYFSSEERRAIEFLFITLNCEKVIIDDLKNAFDVSRNTILSDLKAVKGEVEAEKELILRNTIKEGYFIEGDEMTIRKTIQEKIQELKTPEGRALLKTYMQNTLFRLTENEIDYYELCVCIIKQYELDIKNEYILSDMRTESFMILVSWIRSLKGYTIDMNDDEKMALASTLSFRSVENSMEKMARCGIQMLQEEIYYLSSMLLGIETTGFKTHREEERFIEKIADQFIYNFERITCLVFYNRNKLRHELFHHIRALYYRMKYGNPSDNPLVNDIEQLYPFAFEATRRAVEELGNVFLKDIPRDEIGYLCIYMVSNLDEKKVHQGMKYDGSILIVGPKNMAVATLVKDQLQNLLGRGFRYDVMSLGRLKKRVVDEYVMVVSVDVPRGRIPGDTVVETSTILTKEDKYKMLDILRNQKVLSKYNHRIEDIISIVRENVEQPMDVKELYFGLLHYFNSTDRYDPSNEQVRISANQVQSYELSEGLSWEDVVLRGAEILGGKSERLCARMQNLLRRDKVQNYRFIKDAVLVHYPMQGERDSEIKLVCLMSENGVKCRDGKVVHRILCLSTIDKYSHFTVLDELYRYYETRTRIRELAGEEPV